MRSSQAQNSSTPEKVKINLQRFDKGVYKVKGALGAAWWQNLCQDLDLPEAGSGVVKLEVKIDLPQVYIVGEIKTQLRRQCVRSLDWFDSNNTFVVHEALTLKKDDPHQEALFHPTSHLDMGDYIRQHIILNFDPHPVHLNSANSTRGGVVVSDGLDDVLNTEENPFAALKSLKTN